MEILAVWIAEANSRGQKTAIRTIRLYGRPISLDVLMEARRSHHMCSFGFRLMVRLILLDRWGRIYEQSQGHMLRKPLGNFTPLALTCWQNKMQVLQLPGWDRRNFARRLASCLLTTIYHILWILITTPRRYPNLLHWLPLMLSVERSMLLDEDRIRGNGGDQSGMPFSCNR